MSAEKNGNDRENTKKRFEFQDDRLMRQIYRVLIKQWNWYFK